MFYPLARLKYWSLHLLLFNYLFFPSIPSAFALWILEFCCQTSNIYLLLYLPNEVTLYKMFLFFSGNSFHFKSSLFDSRITNPVHLHLLFTWYFFFHFFAFKLMYFLICGVSLITSSSWTCFLFSLIISAFSLEYLTHSHLMLLLI